MSEQEGRRVRVTYTRTFEGTIGAENEGFIRVDSPRATGGKFEWVLPTADNVTVEWLDVRDFVAEQDELRKRVRG